MCSSEKANLKLNHISSNNTDTHFHLSSSFSFLTEGCLKFRVCMWHDWEEDFHHGSTSGLCSGWLNCCLSVSLLYSISQFLPRVKTICTVPSYVRLRVSCHSINHLCLVDVCNFCSTLLKLNSRSPAFPASLLSPCLSPSLQGVPTQSGLRPWQRGSSQCSGWWRSDSETVGIGLSLPQESTGQFTGGGRGHGDEEVAGAWSAEQKSHQSQQWCVSVRAPERILNNAMKMTEYKARHWSVPASVIEEGDSCQSLILT